MSERRDSSYEILLDVDCDDKKLKQMNLALKRDLSSISLQSFDEGEEVPPTPGPVMGQSFG